MPPPVVRVPKYIGRGAFLDVPAYTGNAGKALVVNGAGTGYEYVAVALAAHAHAGEDITSGTVADARIASSITRDSEVMGLVLANDGNGSGLDADLLRGTTPSTYILTLIDDADAATARNTLGLGALATAGVPGATTQVISNQAGALVGDAGLTYDAATDALTVAGRVVAGTFRAPSDGATAFQFQRAAGDESILTINTVDGIVVINPLGTTSRGLMIGNGTFPGSLSLYAYGHSPGFRQTVARSSGFFAMTFIDGRAKNTTTNLESALVQFGIFGNLQSGSTQPSLGYAYMSSLVSPAYNNANFFMLPTGEIGVGTGNSSPTATLHLAASTTARAQLRFDPTSAADPTSPNGGDVWYNSRLKFRRGATTEIFATGVQATGGASTAGATYTASEQSMLQKVYDAARTFGLLS